MTNAGPQLECQPASPYSPPRDESNAQTDLPSASSKTRPPPGELKPPISILAGAICGMIAAVVYTMANIALRKCVGVDPMLVSAVKAAPTVVLLGPFLIWMSLRGQTLATSFKMTPRFVVASLFAQVIGNGAFQIALGIIGLAASVPITLGVLIIGGAVLGHVMLREAVSTRKVVAMLTLITAVVVLSLPDGTSQPGAYPIWVGALCAAASGAAYAFFGVTMRQALTGGLSAPLTMFISGVVGTIALWSITFARLPLDVLSSHDASQWGMMVAAGVFNFTAFAALSLSLKALPVVAVNLINASQVAMAAIAGVLLFSEPVTASLLIGVILTCLGLVILASRRTKDSGTK